MNYSVVILAAGSGKRMKLGFNKMFLELNHIPLLVLSTRSFFKDPHCQEIIFVTNESELYLVESLVKQHRLLDHRCQFIPGGSERQHSVYNGLSRVTQNLVLIHDGARPFINQSLITNLCLEANLHGCAIPGVALKDTIKIATKGFVDKTLDRNLLYAVQTPQACQTVLIKKAHQLAFANDFLGTDEASLIETYQLSPVKIILGSNENIKLTTSDDIENANYLFTKYF